jgi:hypothetical protein
MNRSSVRIRIMMLFRSKSIMLKKNYDILYKTGINPPVFAFISGNFMGKFLHIELMVSGIRIKTPYYDSHGFQAAEIELLLGKKAFPNCLSISYKVNIPEDTAKSQPAINDLLQNEIDPALHLLSLLLNRPYKFLLYRARINDEEVKYEPPPKPAISHACNFKDPSSRFFEDDFNKVFIRREFCADFQLAIDAFRLLPDAMRRSLELPLHWFGMASQESYSPDRFMHFWTAFKGLYSDPSKQLSEKKAVEYYVEKNADEPFSADFIRCNREFLTALARNRIELRPKRKISEELDRSLQASYHSAQEISKFSLLALLGIRNNFFHGFYSLTSHEVLSLAEIAEAILSDFLRRQLLKLLKVTPRQVIIEESKEV